MQHNTCNTTFCLLIAANTCYLWDNGNNYSLVAVVANRRTARIGGRDATPKGYSITRLNFICQS